MAFGKMGAKGGFGSLGLLGGAGRWPAVINEMLPYLLGWWDFQGGTTDTISSGTLSQVRSSGPGPSIGQQVTSAQPTATSAGVFNSASFQFMRQGLPPNVRTMSLVTAQTLPDASGSDTGKGFTCTGLVEDPTDGTWWVGNHGLNIQGSLNSFAPSIVHLSADFTTKLAEFTLSGMSITPLGTVQGLAFDTTNNNIYFTSGGDGKIYRINRSGAVQASFAAANANGLTYDSLNDRLLMTQNNGDNSTLIAVNKTSGAQTNLVTISGKFIDHLFFDATDNSVWCCGDGPPSFIEKVGLTWPMVREQYLTPAAGSIEGFWLSGDTAYVCNDAYYHSTGTLLNQVLTLSAAPSRTTEDSYATGVALGNRFLVWGVVKSAGAPATLTRCIFAVGEPLVSNSGVGLYLPNGVTNVFRVIVNGQTANHSVTDSSVEFIFTLDVDTVAKTSSLYVNGTFVSTQTMASLSGSLSSALPVTVGCAFESNIMTRHSDITAKIFGAGAGTTVTGLRQKIEGKSAWDTSNSSLLPAGHPYKWYAPGTTGYDAASLALFDAMTSAPTSARRSAIDILVSALKSAGVWTLLDVVYVLAAADSQAACLNWKNPGTSTLTPTSSPTFTADRGFAGDGAASYLLGPAWSAVTQYTQNSNTIFDYVNSNVPSANGEFGSDGASQPVLIVANAGSSLATLRSSSASSDNISIPGGTGFTMATRTGSANYIGQRDATQTTITRVSATTPTGNVVACRAGSGFSTRRVALFGAGGGLSPSQGLAAQAAFLAYLTTVGAN